MLLLEGTFLWRLGISENMNAEFLTVLNITKREIKPPLAPEGQEESEWDRILPNKL